MSVKHGVAAVMTAVMMAAVAPTYGEEAGDLDILLGGESSPAAPEPRPTSKPADEGSQTTSAANATTTQAAPEATPAQSPETVTPITEKEGAAAPRRSPIRTGIEEIVVTAQKRAENIQDVPISIQAFTSGDLDAKGLSDPIKLQAATPGLVYDTVANFAVIFLRGVGTDAFIPSADSSVATYVDGVYFPFTLGAARSFGSVERIEVLKGPQGTLFGRNATGGAVNITTREPSTEEYVVSTQFSAARFNDYKSRLFLSGPLSFTEKTLSGSAGVIYNVEDEYYKLTAASPSSRLEPSEEKGATAKVRWVPWDFFDATLTGYGVGFEGVGTALAAQLAPKPLGRQLGIEDNVGDYKTSINEPLHLYYRTVSGFATLNFRPRWLNVKSISAVQDLKSLQLFDFDGTEKPLVAFGSRRRRPNGPEGPTSFGKLLTQEVQFLSNDNTWGSDRFKWVGGFYYLSSKVGFDPVDFFVEGLDQGVTSRQGPFPFLAPLDNLGIPRGGAHFRTRGLLNGESYAGFFQGTFNLLDWLSITGGGRYQSEHRRVFGSSLSTVLDPSGQEIPINQFPADSLATNDFSPKAVLDVRPLEDVLVYLSYAKGFKSGSFNIINLTKPPDKLVPEKVTAYELGVKSDLFENRFRLNAALFLNNIDDLQVQFISLASGGVVHFENAGKARTKGVDLSAIWAITPELRLDLAGVYLDGQYEEYKPASGFDPQTGMFRNDLDFSGNRIVRNPKYTVSGGLTYTLPLPGGTLDLGIDDYYNSGYFFDAQNAAEQHAYDQVNGRIGYLYTPWNLRLTAFGDNVTNAKRYLFKFPNDFGTIGKLAPPAVYGIRLNWDF